MRGSNATFSVSGWMTCCVEQIRFSTRDYGCILSKRFVPHSPCFDGSSRSVSWLVGKSLDAAYAVVFANSVDRLCVLDAAINYKSLRLIKFYTPNNHVEMLDLFRGIEWFLTSHEVVLAADWNTGLDINIDRLGERSNRNNTDLKPFCNCINMFKLVDKYRNDHPRGVLWRGASVSVLRCSYSTEF